MIFTFYSYKGGAGRSMALANVANWLYLQGLRVLMVDWDLEAPGLEAFFSTDERSLESLQSQLGIIDLLVAYRRQFPTLPLPAEGSDIDDVVEALNEMLPPLSTVLCPIESHYGAKDRREPSLWLLSAGWRAKERFPEYARAVQGFSWSEFYAHFRGEAYFEWLRRQLDQSADVVLVDSRTGVTEMGGVCTRQLADVVVSFCVANLEHLAAVVATARSFIRKEVLDARGRPLKVVVVPARIENSEIDARNRFEKQFKNELKEFSRTEFGDRTFWDLRIPYVPKYAYKVGLAVGAADSAEELETAYRNLAAHLALLAPSDSRLRRVWDEFALTIMSSPVDVLRARRAYERELRDAETTLGPEDPQVARIRANLGLALLSQGDVDQAIPHLKAAAAIRAATPGEPSPMLEPVAAAVRQAVPALAEIAEWHSSKEEYDLAYGYFTDALDLNPDDPDLLTDRGVSYWYAGLLERAISDFDRSLELRPRWPDTLNNRGQVLAEAGRFAAAVTDLQAAIQEAADVSMAYAHNGLGLAYGGLGKFEQALREFDISLRQAPGNAWAYFNRALTYERMGQGKKAITDFKKALKQKNPPLTPIKRQVAQERLSRA